MAGARCRTNIEQLQGLIRCTKAKMQLSVSSKKNKRRDYGDFENESRSISNNHRRGGILSLPVAEPVPETDSVYFRRHHMGWLSAETDGLRSFVS